MLTNYLTIAARNLYKRKFFSFINAFGLSISIAFCGLIFLYIVDEKSFDTFHENGDNIYRVEELSYNQWSAEEGISFDKSAYLQTQLIPVIKEEVPQVVYGTRYNQNDECIIQRGDRVFEETVTFTDPDFFRMFSFRLLEGNPELVFSGLHSAVITPKMARKYFGDAPALDQSLAITINGVTSEFLVTGIIEEHPANSSISYDVIIPQENRPYYEANMSRWNSFNTPGFVQLRPGSDPADLRRNLEEIERKYLSDKIQRWKEESELPDDVDPFSYITTNLKDIHLNTEVDWEKRSDPQYAYILGGIGLLILIIACINYISLSLSTSVARQTEVGIRKAIGAYRNQLFIQFTVESILLALFSMLIGLALLALFLPYFNEFTGKAIALTFTHSWQVFLVSLVLSIFVGFISGGYPAMFLSSYRPAAVLKSGRTSRLKAGFTVPLVLVQFSLSAMLIICSVIMFRQMKYITTKDLGYNADQILVIPTQSGFNEESDRMVAAMRQAAGNSPSVVDIAGTSMSFNRGWSRYGYTIEGEEKFAYVYGVDAHYLPLLGLELQMGRNFSEMNPADSNAIIVNEALVADMGWNSPLDEYLNWREDSLGLGDRVIGVVKNYHFLSLEEEIQPVFLSINTGEVGHLTEIMVKLRANMITEGIDELQRAWAGLVTDKPFNYTFLDENVASQYATYERWVNIMGLSTIFAIVISCLGLFGLSGINAVNRTKEIGIRKAMGAETWNIFVLLNRQFIWISLLAFAIAAPLSWYLMNKWLGSFKYVISISWDIFALSILAGLIIALLTVSYHAVRAANINPADTLKYE